MVRSPQISTTVLLLLLGACFSGGSGDGFQPGTASFSIAETENRSEILRLQVQYSGGCEEHEFRFCWSGILSPSDPPSIPIEAHHYDHGDSCEAFITEDIYVDVSRVARLGEFVSVNLQIRVGDQTVGGSNFNFTANDASFDLSGIDVLPLEEECATIRS